MSPTTCAPDFDPPIAKLGSRAGCQMETRS